MVEYNLSMVADVLLGDSIHIAKQYEWSFAAALKSALSTQAPFNYAEWQRENAAPVAIYTGRLEQTDSTVLLNLNLKSFQAKLNLTKAHYLSVVCANEDDYSSISSWISSGSVFAVVRKVLLVNGVESLSEIIARVECDSPRLDAGASSASVSISGYWSEQFSPKNISLPCPNIKRSLGGRFMMTFPEPDLYLRPGAPVSVPEEVDFIAGSVSYSVSMDGHISMTVTEEEEG